MEKQLSYSYNEVLKIVQKQKKKGFWIGFLGVFIGFIFGILFAKCILL